MQCVSVCNLIFAANWLYELSDASTHKQTVQMQILKVPQGCFDFFEPIRGMSFENCFIPTFYIFLHLPLKIWFEFWFC